MDPHEGQERLLKSTARFIVIEAGRRSGKTELAKRVGVIDASEPHPDREGYAVAYCAPTRDQAKHIYWEDLKKLSNPWWARDPRETDLRIFLRSGSTISVVGMDKPARVEGSPIDRAFVDEMSEMKPLVWDRHLRPALSTIGRLGRAWLYGVPRPGTQFKALVDLAQDPDQPDYEYFHWTSETLTALKAEVDAARRTMDPLIFEQEYQAKRQSFTGMAYYPFRREIHCKALEYVNNRTLVFAFDFNVDPGVAVVLQEQHQGAESFTAVVGEVWIPRNSNTPAVCKRLCQDWAHHKGPVVTYGDATGGARGTAKVLGSDWELIDQYLRKGPFESVGSMVDKGNPRERDRINAVNSRLMSAAEDVRLYIDPAKAPHVVDDLEGVRLLEGGSGEIDKKSDSSLTHLSDALGYYVAKRFPVSEPGFETGRA
jgi:hypothetical protein